MNINKIAYITLNHPFEDHGSSSSTAIAYPRQPNIPILSLKNSNQRPQYPRTAHPNVYIYIYIYIITLEDVLSQQPPHEHSTYHFPPPTSFASTQAQ